MSESGQNKMSVTIFMLWLTGRVTWRILLEEGGMTKKEFDSIQWKAGMRCQYENQKYDVISCNFQEHTVCIDLNGDAEIWLDCEIVELV